MKVVLFDIDGTLLLSDGAGRRAIHSALLEVFGTIGDEMHWFDGKTDRQIVRELMCGAGVRNDEVSANMDVVLERYVLHLESELARETLAPMLFKGVLELLDELEATSAVTLGLLTGNVRAGASQKLRRVGIDPARFLVGAFGCDNEHRVELPAIAHARANELLSPAIPGSAVVIIGDTPADILCGRGIGARAIGVATGRYSVSELATHAPAAVFPDLSDTAAVVRAVLTP